MKIIPADKLFTPRHKDYLGWMGTNPNIQVVDTVLNYPYVWYCACGDGDDLRSDLKKFEGWDSTVISVTLGDADYSGCLSESNRRFHFSTASPVPERCVPYLYQWSDPRKPPYRHKYLAGFQGSFQTNPERAILRKLHSDDVRIVETDWWHSVTSHQDLLRSYRQHLADCKFTLCPRGIGPSSMRLVEAMLAGSIPIMIDDKTHLFNQDPGEFCLWSGLAHEDIKHALDFARKMPPHDLECRQEKMWQFVKMFLLRDSGAGCEGTLGYTEWIREYVEASA